MNIAELVSVVTPAYNASDTLPRAIESVLTQVPSVPYIVVDDCSSDEHKYELGANPGVTLLRNEINLGGASTRNVGLALVKTPYVLFLDADDYILPGTFEELIHLVRADSPDIIYFPWYKVYRSGTMTGPIHNGCRDPLTMFEKWLDGKYVPPCAVLWRVDFLRMIGSWGEGLRYNDDGELSLRALLHNPQIALSTVGGGVYIKGINPKAVSASDLETKIYSSVHIFNSLRKQMRVLPHDPETISQLTSKMGEQMYIFTRLAFQKGMNELAQVALATSIELGYSGYYGTISYRLFARLIGPRYAEMVVSAYRWANKYR
jgi:glycosyltransferase involved in cell wall biosynthesis